MLQIAEKKQTLLSETLLSENQQLAIDRLYETNQTLLIANMGAGKTVILLSAIKELIQAGTIERVLIFGPLKVVSTVWQAEACKWGHTEALNIRLCTGNPTQRDKIVSDAQNDKGILLVNYDLMAWFFNRYKKKHQFDGIVFDEISKLKAGGKGFKRLRTHIESFNWRVGMTGTPVAEDFIGLYYQTYALDAGKRFGSRRDRFLMEYFYPTDYQQYNWAMKNSSAARITNKLSDLVYTVPDYRGELPALNMIKSYVKLPVKVMNMYHEFSRTQVLEINGFPPQSAENAAVLTGKLQQIASGSIYIYDTYGERKSYAMLHTVKLKRCKELVETMNGEPTIICYWFKHELELLQRQFPNAVNLDAKGAQEAWNAGQVQVLLMQPMSASHGIELQHGGHNMIIMSPVWSNDITEQTIARIWRKGQTKPVNVYEIIANGTVDEMIVDRVEGKKKFDEMFTGMLGGV